MLQFSLNFPQFSRSSPAIFRNWFRNPPAPPTAIPPPPLQMLNPKDHLSHCVYYSVEWTSFGVSLV